eukprot:jgi/Tetstr1/449879/TSEL_036938.t1
MIDFACVSSTTPTWSNDPRWCTLGIAATEAEHGKLAADRASSAPVQGVHRYYPSVVEDRGRLGKSALTVVYIFAILTDPSVLVSLPKGSDGRLADIGLFGYGGIRGNTVAVDTTIAPILGVSTSDPTTALRAAKRRKIQKYDEGVRNAAGMLRFVPFAVSEFGSLAPHAEAFLVELAKASQAHTGQKIGQLLSAWRRRFSLLINMAHADNVLGGVAAARAARDGALAPASRRSSACVAMTRVIGCKRPRRT